ncbi:MAG: HAD-IB family phosphatase [Euryarchaeota archaeon]
MNEVKAVAFDCDGVLAANDSSWQNIHDYFGTENKEMLAKFIRKEVTEGAREVVNELQNRGVLVAIVSSGVDLLIGSIANMLKVDDWAANGFEWDEEGWLIGSKPTVVQSHDKGITVEKFARINSIDPENIVSVGDSGPDLSMMIPGSRFIGFNPE